MNAREFFNVVSKMRKAQKDYHKLPSTRNATFKAQYEDMVDAEIERIEKMKIVGADKQQQKLL